MPIRNVKPPYGRTREQTLGLNIRGPARIDTINGQTGVVTTSYTGLASARSYQRCDDVVTPGFQQLKAEGVIVNNPFSKVKVEYPSMGDNGFQAKYTAGGFTHTWQMDRDLAIFSFGIQGQHSVKVLNQTNIVKLAQTAALAGVQPAVMQGLVSGAEVFKTLRMLNSPLRALNNMLQRNRRAYERDLDRFGNAVNRFATIPSHRARQKALVSWKRTDAARQAERSLKRKKDRKIVDRLEFIPNMVLTYNLGWKPLLMDIDAVFHKIPQLEYHERRTARSVKSDKTEWTENKVQTSGSGLVCTFAYKYSEEITVRAGVLYEDRMEPSQHFGVRLRDIPAAGWELIPFSFLVDYAFNIEQFIQALSVNQGVNKLAYFTKITVKTSVSRSWVSCTGPAPWVVNRGPSGVDSASTEATTRLTEAFTPSLAHTALHDQTFRPSAQLQNVLSLLTNTLFGTRNTRYR